MSHHDNHNVQFEIAEVIEINNAFKWNKTIAGQASAHIVKARSCTTYTDVYEMHVVPISNRKISIPLIGEIILIFRTVNKVAKQKVDKAESWYYLQTLDLQGAINNNRSTGMTSTAQEIANNDPQYIPAGTNFEDSVISPLQPYEGDELIQGRFGNSIRFGSTISTIPDDDYYHKPPNWSGDINSDPIIILSNGRTNLPNKEFIVEDIEQDKSSLYLTSTQNINNIIFSTDTPPKDYNDFEGSNFVGIADRLILRSKKDQTIIDSQGDITLNTPNRVMIGSDATRMTGIPQGEQLLNVLRDIAAILKSGHIVEGSISRAVKKDKLKKLSVNIEKILSTKYSIEKN
tara:strand:+ start:353 stop:1387 length:1035 start_codon:yes stop_codon:yes gene_type:complete